MLTLSSLFSPIFNTSGYLPIVAIPAIANIANLVDADNKAKAIKVFTEICSTWYGLPGKANRPNCLEAIQKLYKNPLIKTTEEADAIKVTIIDSLFHKYSAHYTLQLKQDFPDHKQKIDETVGASQRWIVESLSQNGTSSEWLKNKSITYLQNLLKSPDALAETKYTEKDVTTVLLCQYLTQEKTGVNRMNPDVFWMNEIIPMDRGSLIARYAISMDEIIQQIKNLKLEKHIRNQAKIRVWIKTYPTEQWEWSQDALDVLHDVYTNALKFGNFVACRSILACIDLAKHFVDVAASLGVISSSIVNGGWVVEQLKGLIKAWKIADAFTYAKALWQLYIETAFKLVTGAVENDQSGLRMLDYLIANKDLLTNSETMMKVILERKAIIRLTFGDDTYHPEEAKKIIETHPLPPDTLHKIVDNRFDHLPSEPIDVKNEASYISYLDAFPLPQKTINQYKLRVLTLLYKQSFNRDIYLNDTVEHNKLLETLKTKFNDVRDTQLPKNLSDEQSYIAGEVLEEAPAVQKKKLQSIFGRMLHDHQETVMLKLIDKARAKYEIDYAHRLPALMQSVVADYKTSYDGIQKTLTSIASILEDVATKDAIYTGCIEKITPKIIKDIAEWKDEDKKKDKNNHDDEHEDRYDEEDEDDDEETETVPAKKILAFILSQIDTIVSEKDRERIKKHYIDNMGTTAMQQWVLKVMKYIIDNFIVLIDNKKWRISELFHASVNARDYDISENLLSHYGKYVSSDITLQQIKVKKVQKSMEKVKSKGLLEEDFKSLLHLIQNVWDDTKVITELMNVLSEYAISTQEGYDFFKEIYRIDVNRQIRATTEKKIIDCSMAEVDLPGKSKKIDVDLKLCYNILKKLCDEKDIHEDLISTFPRVIDRLYRRHTKKYRGAVSTSQDYYDAYMFAKQIYEHETSWRENNIQVDREDRHKKKQKAKLSYVASELTIIENSMQLLRGIKNVYIDQQKTLGRSELEACLKHVHAFSIEHAAPKASQERILSLRKEYYALTNQIEKLNALIAQWTSEDQKMQALKQDLIDFLHDKGNVSLQQLEDLIALFGIDSAADILFSTHPQFRALSTMEVKSLIAEHLWDVLLQHRWLSFGDIPASLNISPKKFQDNMLTVIEKDFLKYYRDTKKLWPVTNKDICTSYIASLKDKCSGAAAHKDILEAVIEKFSVFLDQILDIQIPDRLVTSLDTDREFPDFLQKLNAIEVLNKKRFLIADGMWMGKSLSAILAKEVAKFKKCLLIVPSNTMDTWSEYLSDKVDPQGKPVWYFAKGQTPKVLVINALDDLSKLSADDDYEYVIISQERLASEKSIDTLLAQKFDYVIVDEVHKLKNLSSGKRASWLLDIVGKIEHMDGYLCLLSGTPIPNTIIDIAMLIKLLYPEEYGSWSNQELVASIINGDVVSLRSLLLPRMQMKELTENINMPDLYEETKYIDFSDKEKFYYDSIRNDENLTALSKIMLLRKLAISPKLLWIEDIDASSKAIVVGADANELFKTKRKVVFFFNAFINGVLRPTDTIPDTQTFISQMKLDPDIQVRIIDGNTSKEDRKTIQDEFAQSSKKIALFVSGQTADVWIDLTAWEEVVEVVSPRTKGEKSQQLARVYRYRQKKDITSLTYIVRNSIEKLISDYVLLKDKAIMKLYHGLKLSELERMVLQDNSDVSSDATQKELNRWLIRYFKKSSEELRDFYAETKNVWSEKMQEIIAKDGENIAWYYRGLGPRSYQANVNRWHATIISSLLSRDDIEQPTIVDLWSWPKMLYQHIKENLQDNVISLDLNKHNFSEDDIATGKAIVANFAQLPFEDNSVDIISCSLAFNDTSRNLNTGSYERLDVLCQLHRVLKVGWSAIISLPHSLMYKDRDMVLYIIRELGFAIEDKYSGSAIGEGFKAETLTLTKTDNRKRNLDHMVSFCKSNDLGSGLVLSKNPEKIVASKDVITSVSLAKTKIPIKLNKLAKKILQTEQNYKNLIEEWVGKYGELIDIPSDILRSYGFWRYYTKKSCVLLTQLPNDAWLFSYRKLRNLGTEDNT